MKILDQQQFNELIALAPLRPRLKNELRFIKSIEHMSARDWEEHELLAITDRTEQKGVLLLSLDESLYIVPYEISRGITSATGKTQSIICDFCHTWQSGARSGSISFPKDRRSINTLGFLCCADLECSSHVRSKTSAARISRAQLREDLTAEQRINRLNKRLQGLVENLGISAVAKV